MRNSRRGILVIGALVVFACYTVHMDEKQVKTIAAQDMDCDESLIHLETGDSNEKHVAHYIAHGCERTRDFECTTDPNGYVTCHAPRTNGSDTKSSGDHEVATAVGAAAVGCACAGLFAHHSSDPSTTTAPSNPNSTTPQRSR